MVRPRESARGKARRDPVDHGPPSHGTRAAVGVEGDRVCVRDVVQAHDERSVALHQRIGCGRRRAVGVCGVRVGAARVPVGVARHVHGGARHGGKGQHVFGDLVIRATAVGAAVELDGIAGILGWCPFRVERHVTRDRIGGEVPPVGERLVGVEALERVALLLHAGDSDVGTVGCLHSGRRLYCVIGGVGVVRIPRYVVGVLLPLGPERNRAVLRGREVGDLGAVCIRRAGSALFRVPAGEGVTG